MEASSVRGVLFVKDLVKAAAFYVGALGLTRVSGDKDHAVLRCDAFELVVQQIPREIAATIVIAEPPIRRVWGAIRLDFPVASVDESRRLARSLGGDVDAAPPPWAERDANLFFGYDPEGNQFGVSRRK
ncbi:MAG TPA: VOC family protein [Gammaproteobacteria bacterium]|nr:VOC family protein [Gammaproteobacteria bacterium]